MLIWDYIRDFLVRYIFGGIDSNGDIFSGYIGNTLTEEGSSSFINNSDFLVPINGYDSSYGEVVKYISFADWLSTTTTIIIMCVIVFLFALLVRWVFKQVTSAFLLR